MVEYVAIGVGAWLVLRGAGPRKQEKPSANGGTQPSREMTKDELAQQGLVVRDPWGLGLLPSGNDAVKTGLAVSSTVASLTGLAAALGGATVAAGPAAIAAVASGASAAAGLLMTQDKWGAAVGAIAGIGTVFNAGRVLGREIDKIFGGTGDNEGVTSIVSQVVFGVMLAVGYVFGAVASVILIPLALATLGIASWISDENRKARGQAGAWDDLRNRFDEVFNAAFNQGQKAVMEYRVSEKLEEALRSDEVIEIKANAALFALGYALKLNGLHKTQWVVRPHGLGVDDAGHEKWGRDRDYWVEDESLIYRHAYSLVGVVDAVPAFGENVIGGIKARSPDATRRCFLQGQLMANLDCYLTWMQSGWGVGQSGESHARFGYEQVRAFDADEITAGGNILYLGVWVYWEESQRNERPIFSGSLPI